MSAVRRIISARSDLKPPWALEAVDDILAEFDRRAVTANEEAGLVILVWNSSDKATHSFHGLLWQQAHPVALPRRFKLSNRAHTRRSIVEPTARKVKSSRACLSPIHLPLHRLPKSGTNLDSLSQYK